MKRFLKRIKAPIPVLCYVLCALWWLLGSLAGFASDAFAKQTGSMYQFSLQAESFVLTGMELLEDGRYTTVDGDPQMIWQNTDDITLRTLRTPIRFEGSPREMCLYYTTEPGEAFGVNKRVFASQQNDGSYLYTLPAKKITALRLDPCSPVDRKTVKMEFGTFTVNEAVPFYQYFAPGWAGFFSMLMLPGLCAAVLRVAHDGLLWYKTKRKK